MSDVRTDPSTRPYLYLIESTLADTAIEEDEVVVHVLRGSTKGLLLNHTG